MISKKTLLAWHSWVGLKLSLLMFIVCLTGTFAVISHELDWLFTEDLRITAQEDKNINWGGIYKNVKAEYPQRSIITLNAPLYSNFASIVITEDPEFGLRRVFVNPYTGEVKGDLAYYASFQRSLRDLHRYLFSPTGGVYLVGPLGVILLLSTISALFFYKKWWQGFFKLRLHSRSRAFWGSLHKVVGLWSLWFLLLIGITGTWYLAEKIIADTGGDIQPRKVVTPIAQIKNNNFFENQVSTSQVIIAAKQAIPNLKPTAISFSNNQSAPIRVSGYTDAILVRPRSNSVFIDPVTGQVIDSIRTQDQNALSIWIEMADPLHFGNFSSLGVKLIWFSFGLLLCVMSASGIVIFVKRIQKRREGSWIKNILGGMKYITFIVLIIPFIFGTILTLFTLNMIGYVEDDTKQILAPKSFISGFPQMNMYLSKNEIDSDNTIFIRLGADCQNCISKKYKAELVLEDGKTIKFKKGLLKGYRGTPSANIPTKDLSQIKHIELKGSQGESVLLYIQQ